MQSRAAKQTDGIFDWPTCRNGDSSECTGVQVAPYGRCWAHLSAEELQQAVSTLEPGDDLDLRGTTLRERRLTRILGAFHDHNSRGLLIGNASFENSQFEGSASFGSAVFNGEVRSFEAKFKGKADFYAAKFNSYAGFNNAEFGYADFEKAEFSGGVVSFKYVKFHETAEFTDTKFSHRVEFTGADFQDWAPFSGARFIQEARFGGVQFRGIASFQRTDFSDLADFGCTEFASEADFTGARFSDETRFGASKFGDNAWITDCTFSGKAGFSEARFSGGAWFSKTRFKGDVTFAHAKFDSDAIFDNVDFGGDAEFSEVEVKGMTRVGPSTIGGEFALYGFNASGTVEINAAPNRITCKRANFADRVFLSLAGGNLWLTDSKFAAPASIESSLRSETGADWGLVQVRSLRGTDAEHLTLTDVDLGHCILSGLRRPEQLRLAGRCVFAPTPRGWYWRSRVVPWWWTARGALFEEHLWRASPDSPGPHTGWASPQSMDEETGEATPERLEVLYRQLRSSLEGASNEPGAADFYYGEMEMRRRASRNKSERWLLSGYWLISGYGLRGSRALFSVVALIFLAALVLQRTGFAGSMPGYLYCALYATGSVLSISLANGHLPTVLTVWGDVIRIVLRIGGPVLLGLAAFAVRGRLKR